MTGARFRAKGPSAGLDTGVPQLRLEALGQSGNDGIGVRVVRLISRQSLAARAASVAVRESARFAREFRAQLVITAGGFGVTGSPYPSEGEKQGREAIERFVREVLQLIPARRSFAIILGVDTRHGELQEAWFIPASAQGLAHCVRAWKSYPRSDEARYVITKGRACPARTVHVANCKVSMLICHDLAAFSGRSLANRGQEKEGWANQLDSEVLRGANTGVVHLIHYLDEPSQGGAFTNGMASLIGSGVAWGISTFKTSLDLGAGLGDLREIQERTARFAGPTLDVYVASEENAAIKD